MYFSLPIHSEIENSKQDVVIEAVQSFIGQFNLKQENFNFKKIFRNITFFSFLFICQIIHSQVEVKTNLLTSIVLVPNFGVEIKVKKSQVFQVDFLGFIWDSVEPLNNSLFMLIKILLNTELIK